MRQSMKGAGLTMMLLAGAAPVAAVEDRHAGPQASHSSTLRSNDVIGEDSERLTLARAVQLLDKRPVRVVVIDAHRARPDVQPTLLRLDAFVLRGGATVYVVRQSELLRAARRGSSVHLLALAAVLWHEMAHVAGGDEREARRREEALWARFIRDQLVDPVIGLRYLSALAGRHEERVEGLTP